MKSKKFSRNWKKGAITTMFVSASLSAACGFVACKGDPAPVAEGLGVFYYDTGIDEYQLSLDDGNKATFLANGESKTGTYTNDGGVLKLKFEGSEDELTATLSETGLTLNYDNAELRFFKKVYYTVAYDEVGGGEVADTKVVNGKTVAKPADPVKEGYEFLGWYADSDYQTPYLFGTQIVTGNITLYAQWALVNPGVAAYVVDFDLGYEGEAPAPRETIGGKLYNAPEVEREGYKFCGWWISMYENGEKLTRKYTPDTVFTANTTLFAVWESEDLGSKLANPEVEVFEDSIKWNGAQGVSVYKLKVTGPDGFLTIDEDVSATNYAINFANAPAGDYTIEVTAVASNRENNSDTVVRCYKNKAIGRVSQFSVLDGKVLLFNRVPEAETYYITVDCGNDAHNHTMYNNGDSTYYNFSNCEMQEGGIKFTVTAVAAGYAAVESETFAYNPMLAKVEGVSVDEETQILSWYPVKDATNYIVSIVCGDSSHQHALVDVGSRTSYSLKECPAAADGNIKINVYAKTKGYNSPAATEYSYAKTKMAAPGNLAISTVEDRYVLTWNAVSGATAYEVKIGSKIETVTTNSCDLTELVTWVDEMDYEIQVKAKTDTNESVWSETLDVRYKAMTNKMTYKGGVLSWEPVLGAKGYEIKVNDGEIQTVENGNTFAEIELTKEGTNTVYVRFMDTPPSAWAIFTIENAQEVVFDSRGGSPVASQYKVMGDKLELPTPTREGYDFVGWYNTPKGPESNGAKYESGYFTESQELVLYAYWSPASYKVEYDVRDGGEMTQTSGSVVYTKHYKLDVPTVTDGETVFLGWFAATDSSSEQLTDDRGYSIKPWNLKSGATVYAQYIKNVLSFTLLENDTYSVSRGINASKLTTITIPQTYNNKPVTVVDGYAFQNCAKLVSVNIPDTIEIVAEETAFYGCKKLEAVNVISTGNNLAVYSSVDGVLIHKNEITGAMELSYYPLGKTGAYEVPEGVTEIPLRLFDSRMVTEVTIPTTVTVIRGNAFIDCASLTKINFAAGGTDDLVIEEGAFRNCIALSSVTFPARLTELQVNQDTHTMTVFEGCSSLTHINVERGNQVYASNDGVITNKAGTMLLFCPTARRGSYTIPQGIEQVGAYAFNGCNRLTEIVVPGYVEEIGEYAFANCARVTRIEFAGGAVLGMSTELAEGAFANLTSLKVIDFAKGSVVTKIGDYAFSGASALRKLTIPTTLEYVGSYAFEKAEALAEVVFENGEEGSLEFGNYVFNECIGLTKVSLPKSVTKLNLGVFDGCVNIAEIKVDGANEHYKDIEGVVFSKDGKELVFFPKGNKGVEGVYDLPDGVETISEGAFKGSYYVQTIVIDNTVTHIGKYAFAGSASLANLTFAEGNDNAALVIDEEAFANCAAITEVSLPARTQKIAAKAFYNVNMTAVSFPENLEEIGDQAFAKTAITKVTVPANVAVFGEGVFDGCIKLAEVTFAQGYQGKEIPVATFQGTAITEIVIPASVETIGYAAFNECEKLTKITFEDSEAPLAIGVPSKNEQTAYATATGAFMNCKSLQGVVIPDRVTLIGNFAFANCSALAKAEISETSNLQRFGTSAFAQCSRLTSIYVPKTVQNTAYVDENTTQEYAIGESAFAKTGIKEVIFAEGGTGEFSIGQRAFENTAIKTLNIPSRLAPIYVVWQDATGIVVTEKNEGFNKNSFPSLNAINIGEGGKYYGSRDGVVYKLAEVEGSENEYVEYELMLIPTYSQESITIPYTVGQIGLKPGILGGSPVLQSTSGAKLKTITFEATPDGVTPVPLSIGASAFSSLTSLTSVEFPERLVYLGVSAFSSTKLTSVHLPSTLEKIDAREAGQNETSSTFGSISTLTSVTFAKGINLKVIPGRTFYQCTNANFTTLEIPASVERIGAYAFGNCKIKNLSFEEGSKLTTIGTFAFQGFQLTELTLPESVTTLDGKVFNSMSKLAKLTLPKSFTSFTTYIGDQPRFLFDGLNALKEVVVSEENPYFMSHEGAVYTKNAKTGEMGDELIYYPKAKHTTYFSYTTPKGVKSIGSFAFYSNAKLQSLTISSDLMYINNCSFQSCSYLTNITFEAREVPLTIGDKAFMGCARLNGVTKTVDGVSKNVFEIPSSVKFEGSDAFNGCFRSGVTNLHIEFVGENESTSMTSTFSGCTGVVAVENLPVNLTSMTSTFNGCTKLATVTFNDDPNGFIAEMKGTFNGCTALKKIDLPAVGSLMNKNAISALSSNPDAVWEEGTGNQGTFQGCTALESITIKDCNIIGVAVFMNCYNLKTIELPDNIVSIDQGAFFGCTKLQSVKLPANLETINHKAFKNCSALQSIETKDFLVSIGKHAFEGCTALNSVSLGANVLTVREKAFYNLRNLQTVKFSDVLDTIEPYAFYGAAISSIELPTAVKTVGEYAFAECKNVTTITVPDGLETLGDYAFSGCSKVETFKIPAALSSLGIGVFNGWDSLKELTADGSNLDYAFKNGVLYNSTYTKIIYVSATTSGRFEVPNTIVGLAEGLFAGTAITEIVLPNTIREIPAKAFQGCRNLTTVVMPAALEKIGDLAFEGCTSLKSITIPKTVYSTFDAVYFDRDGSGREAGYYSAGAQDGIGHYAFGNCTALENVIFEEGGTKRLSFGDFAFYGCTSLKGTLNETTGEYEFVIPARVRGEAIPQNALWTTGGMGAGNAHENKMEQGIGMYAFARCTALENVVFEDEGKVVMQEKLLILIGAFQECVSLKSVKFGDTLGDKDIVLAGGKTGVMTLTKAAISENAFKGCTNLQSVTFPKDVSKISVCENAFADSRVALPGDLMLVPGSQGMDMGGGKADWQDGGSRMFGIDGCLDSYCAKNGGCEYYDPHNGLFTKDYTLEIPQMR